MKTPHGVKEYNYNTQMFKLFQPKTETVKEKEKEKHTKTIEESEVKSKRKFIPVERMVDPLQGQKRPRKKCYPMLKFLKPQHKS